MILAHNLLSTTPPSLVARLSSPLHPSSAPCLDIKHKIGDDVQSPRNSACAPSQFTQALLLQSSSTASVKPYYFNQPYRYLIHYLIQALLHTSFKPYYIFHSSPTAYFIQALLHISFKPYCILHSSPTSFKPWPTPRGIAA